MATITLHGKRFVPSISKETIQSRIQELASAIELDYANQDVLCLGVLTGGYVFTADLTRCLQREISVAFVKMKSYEGTQSTGSVHWQLPVPESIEGKHVLVIEDIIDTGLSMQQLLAELALKKPASVKIATLLFKPDALLHPITPDYIGFTIPSQFVVGYGLDYDGLGRNLPQLYVAE